MTKLIITGMPRTGMGYVGNFLNKKGYKVDLANFLPYKFNRQKLKDLVTENELFNVHVGHFYIQYLETLFKYYNYKTIILLRDKKEIVESVKQWKFNPYHQKKLNGAESYPYHCKNVDTATHYYFDEYTKKLEDIRRRYSDKILIINTKDLNNKECLNKILNYCDENVKKI